MAMLLVLPLLLLVSSFSSGLVDQCRTSCIGVEIRHPYGIDDGCGDPLYRLDCSSKKGTLTLPGTSVSVLSINYEFKKVTINSTIFFENPLLLPVLNDYLHNYSVILCGRLGTDFKQQTQIPGECTLIRREMPRTLEGLPCYDYPCHSSNVLSIQRAGSEVSSSRGRRLAFWAWSALSSSSASEKRKHWAMVAVGALAAVITFWSLFLLAALFCFFYYTNKNRSKRRDLEIELVERVGNTAVGKTAVPRLRTTEYSYQQLHTATRGFSKQFRLGSGGFGTVYMGILPDNTTIAVKRPNERCLRGTSSKLFAEQFLNEINILSQVNHRNLVELLGFCKCNDKLPMLVYEYVPNGTLADHLHSKSSLLSSWGLRLDIAIQTAEGLSYLHAAANPPIYHRDIKSSNILLDNKLNVKVADFGISKLVSTDVSYISTAVQGTLGYLDPEYFRSCRYTDKSDVYSFGMVLLELVTGQKAIDSSRRTSNINLAVMSSSAIKSDMVLSIVDPKLVVAAAENRGILESITEVAKLALECMAISREGRPNMKEVLGQLWSIKG